MAKRSDPRVWEVMPSMPAGPPCPQCGVRTAIVCAVWKVGATTVRDFGKRCEEHGVVIGPPLSLS